MNLGSLTLTFALVTTVLHDWPVPNTYPPSFSLELWCHSPLSLVHNCPGEKNDHSELKMAASSSELSPPSLVLRIRISDLSCISFCFEEHVSNYWFAQNPSIYEEGGSAFVLLRLWISVTWLFRDSLETISWEITFPGIKMFAYTLDITCFGF